MPVRVGPLDFIWLILLFKAGPTSKLNSVWKLAQVAQCWALPRMEILQPLWAVCSNAALSGLNLEAIHHITTTSGSTFLTAFLMQSVCWHVGCSISREGDSIMQRQFFCKENRSENSPTQDGGRRKALQYFILSLVLFSVRHCQTGSWRWNNQNVVQLGLGIWHRLEMSVLWLAVVEQQTLLHLSFSTEQWGLYPSSEASLSPLAPDGGSQRQQAS